LRFRNYLKFVELDQEASGATLKYGAFN